VHSKEAGREGSAPTSYIIVTPTPLGQRKAASRQPIVRGCSGVAGVPSPGHAFKRTSREPRRASDLSRAGCGSAQPEKNQVPRERGCPRGSEQTLDVEYLPPRETGGGREGSASSRMRP